MEEQVYHQDGVRTYLSVKFPLYDEVGAVSGLCGISADITGIKKAQEQLKRLSGSIMANQENERALLARELHDELGQLLHCPAPWIAAGCRPAGSPRCEGGGTRRDHVQPHRPTIEEVRGLAVRLAARGAGPLGPGGRPGVVYQRF